MCVKKQYNTVQRVMNKLRHDPRPSFTLCLSSIANSSRLSREKTKPTPPHATRHRRIIVGLKRRLPNATRKNAIGQSKGHRALSIPRAPTQKAGVKLVDVPGRTTLLICTKRHTYFSFPTQQRRPLLPSPPRRRPLNKVKHPRDQVHETGPS